jgi:hypothetical protein
MLGMPGRAVPRVRQLPTDVQALNALLHDCSCVLHSSPQQVSMWHSAAAALCILAH